ncbi:hypothetical protein HYD71_00915 [Mycoplasmopsis bovis]|nr:hypothetical protein [Mycoplasmopsis bovis]QQH49467.1 hypothetical protein HYD71_00915 [Mycoplasmopsis bovis]
MLIKFIDKLIYKYWAEDNFIEISNIEFLKVVNYVLRLILEDYDFSRNNRNLLN